MKVILSGKHNNKAWMVNECFAEAMSQIYCERSVKLQKSLEVKTKMAADRDSEDLAPFLESEELKINTQA